MRKLKQQITVLDGLDDGLRIFAHTESLQDLGSLFVRSRSHDTKEILVRLTFNLEVGQLAFLRPQVCFCRECRVFAGCLSFDANRTSRSFGSALHSSQLQKTGTLRELGRFQPCSSFFGRPRKPLEWLLALHDVGPAIRFPREEGWGSWARVAAEDATYRIREIQDTRLGSLIEVWLLKL